MKKDPKCFCHECMKGKCDSRAAGHFIGGPNCKFVRHESVGKFCISTVGDYWPPGDKAKHEIGYNRFYETMVFNKRARGGNRWRSVDFEGYSTEGEAEAGHKRMVAKFWTGVGVLA